MRRTSLLLFTLVAISLLSRPLLGADLPDAPPVGFSPTISLHRGAPEAGTLVTGPRNHSFFEPGNKIRMAALAALVAADGFTTQRALEGSGSFREVNPLARPFVNHGAAGQAEASSLGLGASIGAAYLLHKTGHHKLERWVFNGSIAVEAETVSSNTWYLLR